ncbi:MAG: hypothetical protein KAW56_05155 [Candidatus Marinimicrobia bacterium]|nr:hypothetical protein [Candidatus Neomarinimicrobiota bacterium]
MEKLDKKTLIWIAIGIGAMWGLSEALIGMSMRDTSVYFITGSLMTGIVALLLSFGYASIKKFSFLFVALGMVILFKLLDAFMLHLPVVHGAVGNPIFAMVVELLAFVFVFTIIRKDLLKKIYGLAISGGLFALISISVFPLVKYFTGVPACVVKGTTYPLSIYYSPIAIGLSAIAFPVGTLLGARFAKFLSSEKSLTKELPLKVRWALQGATVIMVSLAVLIRL